MLRIAGQTTGPIGLKFFVDTHGWPGVLWPVKMEFFPKFVSQILFPRATPGPLASILSMNI